MGVGRGPGPGDSITLDEKKDGTDAETTFNSPNPRV